MASHIALSTRPPIELPDTWYHGSLYAFSEFTSQPAVRGSMWNTFLGPHFSNYRRVAEHFARGLYQRQPITRPGWLYTVKVSLERPICYASESDLAHHGYRFALKRDLLTGKELLGLIHPALQYRYRHFAGDAHMLLEKAQTCLPFGQHLLDKLPAAAKRRVAKAFHAALVEAGYDGIVYGNDIEHGEAAIALDPKRLVLEDREPVEPLGRRIQRWEVDTAAPVSWTRDGTSCWVRDPVAEALAMNGQIPDAPLAQRQSSPAASRIPQPPRTRTR